MADEAKKKKKKRKRDDSDTETGKLHSVVFLRCEPTCMLLQWIHIKPEKLHLSLQIPIRTCPLQ